MNYNESVRYLKSTALRGSKMGLERISSLLDKIGNPHEKVKVIHVSGTNGKGSFGAMMTSVLKNAGYKVGWFSSPAITEVTDSFRIDCEEISKEEFAEIVTELQPICESMEDLPTEFEIQTAIAFMMFIRNACNIAVIECGMGGDTDSTNIIKSPLLSVITNVQRDHKSFLGDTIVKIAEHKAGIIKQNRPIYFGGTDENALKVISETAQEKCSKLYISDYSDIKYTWASYYGTDGTEILYKGIELKTSLLGTYQAENMKNVLNCIEILKEEGLEIPYSAVKEGLAKTRWHGRFEVLRKKPLVIFDGAHNPDGIKFMADSLHKYFGRQKAVMIIGVMADKEYTLYADILHEFIEMVYTVTPDHPRSLDCSVLAAAFTAKEVPAAATYELPYGVYLAYKYAKENKIPLIAVGSLYMYREFVKALDNIKD